jgi:hypothetical protein
MTPEQELKKLRSENKQLWKLVNAVKIHSDGEIELNDVGNLDWKYVRDESHVCYIKLGEFIDWS